MKRMRPSAALAAVVILVTACGGDNQTDGSTTQATVTPGATSGAVDAPSTTSSAVLAAHSIVSLSPTATEMLFAIGAGAQVVAVDDQSTYPPEALEKPHAFSGLAPDVEAIAALKPDLVVIADDSKVLTDQLEGVGLAVWNGPAATSLDNIYEQMEQLGGLTGHVAEAASLVAEMEADIDAAVATAPQPPNPLTYYHELDKTLFSVTENTFIGHVYSLFGLRSIADFQEVDSDYPQLSADEIMSSDPDFIFLADGGGGESPATVAARPGWSSLTAVADGNVVLLDADTASRWGPRIVDFVRAVAAVMSTASVPG
jgi:cobalamin transport system substrate-binding protein